MAQATRPHIPEYGILPPDEGLGLLPWSWAVERLQRSHNYWVATVQPDARPHLMPVWGVWLDDKFFFSTGRQTRKARNLNSNPRCSVTTESAQEAVIVEGQAFQLIERGALIGVAHAYADKYGEPYPDESAIYAVHPEIVFGFIEQASQFAGSATKWLLRPGDSSQG